MSKISNSSSSGYQVATRTIVTKRSPNKTGKYVRPGAKNRMQRFFYGYKVLGIFVSFC